MLVGGRFDKLVVETETARQQDFGPAAIKCQKRGGKGAKPGVRTKFTRVVPPPIELVNWDEVEGKVEADETGMGTGPTNGIGEAVRRMKNDVKL